MVVRGRYGDHWGLRAGVGRQGPHPSAWSWPSYLLSYRREPERPGAACPPTKMHDFACTLGCLGLCCREASMPVPFRRTAPCLMGWGRPGCFRARSQEAAAGICMCLCGFLPAGGRGHQVSCVCIWAFIGQQLCYSKFLKYS